MRILIVTFSGDIPLLELQLESIDKFLESCIIDIIINDINPKPVREVAGKWAAQMSRHTVRIHNGTDNIPSIYGQYFRYHYTSWHCQQLHKIINHIDEPYIVLDTKDIFIKRTTLLELSKTQQTWWLKDWDESHRDFIDFAREAYVLAGRPEKMDQPKKELVLRNFTTPFIIQPIVIEKVKKVFDNNLEDFYTWFLSFGLPSEFLLHEVFRQCNDIPTPWPEIQKDFVVTMRHTNQQRYKWNGRTWHHRLKDTTHILQIHMNLYGETNVKKDVREYFDKLPIDHP